ncbi:MAG: GHMP kinase [Actinomycetota bacterium]|nr:GHMP kinase [Actinomycetota bacterium]
MLFRARAPLRVSFAGGGTDVPPFPEQEGGLVLNATINRYAYGTLRPRADDQIKVESADFGLSIDYDRDAPLVFDGKLDLVKAAIRKLERGEPRGFDLFLRSSAPPGSGLGSSSTLMVTLVGLLKEFHGLPLTDYEIAQLSHTVERADVGIVGGSQDQYAATFGGFNFIEFGGDQVIVNPLRIKADVIHELEHNMLLYYTGKTRRSDGIIEDQTARFEGRDENALAGLRMQKQLAVEMKNVLLRGECDAFGDLLDEAWRYKKKMSPRISNPAIDEAYDEARKHGALGGKVTGAGGGGYMLLYCAFERKHRVAEALAQLGGHPTEFAFEFGGLSTWTVPG